jgi:hypothetical protein
MLVRSIFPVYIASYADNLQFGEGASTTSDTVADAGSSVDGGNEEQEGVDVDLSSASMGLERLKASAM